MEQLKIEEVGGVIPKRRRGLGPPLKASPVGSLSVCSQGCSGLVTERCGDFLGFFLKRNLW